MKYQRATSGAVKWTCPGCGKLHAATGQQESGREAFECVCGWRKQGPIESFGVLEQPAPKVEVPAPVVMPSVPSPAAVLDGFARGLTGAPITETGPRKESSVAGPLKGE